MTWRRSPDPPALPVCPLSIGILFLAAAVSAAPYTLAVLPSRPAVPAPLPADTVPMGDPASFPETNMAVVFKISLNNN